MELLKRYINDVGKDLVLDDFNLKEKQLKLPTIKHFWAARLIEARVEKNRLEKEKRERKKSLTREVLATSPVRINQVAAEQAAERHESLQELTEKIQEYSLIIDYLEKVEKIMHQMTWDVKNIVELNKLEQL